MATIEEVQTMAEAADTASNAFATAVSDLAAALGMDPQNIFERIAPKSFSDAGETSRIVDYLTARADLVTSRLEAMAVQDQRQALIDSLELTQEQKDLLGL